jgi:hypothetical protein
MGARLNNVPAPLVRRVRARRCLPAGSGLPPVDRCATGPAGKDHDVRVIDELHGGVGI